MNSPCINAGDPSLTDPDGSISDIGVNVFSQEATITINVFEGWNMIGLPIISESTYYQDIFDNTIENSLYLFNSDGTYILFDSLEIGNGYWLRFDTTYEITLSGLPLNDLIINLDEGWNMISGISFSLSVNMINDPNNLIIPGTIFIFDNNYLPAEHIEPGYGYWLRSISNGQIQLFIDQNY